MKIRAASIALVAATLFAVPVSAAEDPYLILGNGADTCEVWTEGRAESPTSFVQAGREAWVLGFLTGVMRSRSSNLGEDQRLTEGVDDAELMAWIDGLCADQPLFWVSDAVWLLKDALLLSSVRRRQ